MKTISFGGITGGNAARALAKKGGAMAKKGLHGKPLAGINPRKALTADALQLSKKSPSIKPR